MNVKYTTRDTDNCKIYSITWTIQKFLYHFNDYAKREIRTDKQNENENENSGKFQLKIKFVGKHNNLIEIYYLSPISVFLKSELFRCINRCEERSVIVNEYQIIQGNKWQFLATLFKHDIEQNTINFLLCNQSLCLKFNFYVNNDVKIDQSVIPEAQMSSDFEKLLNNALFSDVTIKSIEGIEYNVHKAVLACRSVVLKAHFEHNTTECFTNIIESALESEVLREVLTFIYTDKAPQVDKMPEKLLAAADYYQLNMLKNLCEKALHKKLTVENAIETLQLADLHSSATLKHLTLEFVKDGQAKLITETEGWRNVQSVELVKKIYEYIMDDFTI